MKLNESGFTDKAINFTSCGFTFDENDQNDIIALGTDGTHGNIKILDEKDDIRQNYEAREMVCSYHQLLKTTTGLQNLITGTERGNIKVYNFPLSGRPFEEFNVHYGDVSQITVSPDSKFVFSAGTDGSIFIYSVTEYLNELEIYKPSAEDDKIVKENEFKNFIVDEELADVAMIKRQETEEWTKKQEQLKNEMEDAQHKLESSVTEIKN